MLIEEKEKKRTISFHPVTLFVCFVCLVGLSVMGTYLIMQVVHRSQLDNKNLEVLTVQKNNEVLAGQNSDLKNSLQKLEDQYDKLNAQLSEMEALKAERQTVEQKNSYLEEVPVLKPTWVNSGATTLAFEGNLSIVLHEASEQDGCEKDSAAVSYLAGDTDKKKLCLRTGKPENFTYQGKEYLFNLAGIAAKANVYRYCISISLEQ